ncbi:uncharacterized protein TM35_000222130 [Trypanosoma theileri]|uniref:Uncharacterized protein n=1 Tax=Trypanosoma theileri TaxID=67003 RepID=A0A1X0NRT8_9TRYP|nr:uncharacterized protein TM35_000222130 [Trypanosoma theileri]ORC87414.1 hypothetical protein TM35_000222130 [Trypanosoma theileri]
MCWKPKISLFSHNSSCVPFLVIFAFLSFFLVCTTTDALNASTLKDISINASDVVETTKRDLANFTTTLLLLIHDDTLSASTRDILKQQLSTTLLSVKSFTQDVCTVLEQQWSITSTSTNSVSTRVSAVENALQIETVFLIELSHLCRIARRRLRRWDAKLIEIFGNND